MSGRNHAQRLNTLWELGEEGERALLQIARSDSAAKACGDYFSLRARVSVGDVGRRKSAQAGCSQKYYSVPMGAAV